MFNFKIKVNNEHKLQTKIKNEHLLHIVAFGATIYESLMGNIKYTSKTVISRAVVLVRAKSSTAYRMTQTIGEKVGIRFLVDAIIYKLSPTIKDKFLLRLRPLSLTYKSITTNLKERFEVRFRTKDITYSNNTKMVSEKMLAQLRSTTVYKYSTSNIMRVWVRLRSKLTFISSTTLIITAKIRSLSSFFYTFKTSLSEKFLLRSSSYLNYIHGTNITKDGVQARTTSDTNYRNTTSSLIKAWVRAIGNNVMSSKTTLLIKSWLRASGSTVMKYTFSIFDILGVRGDMPNKITHATQMIKEGVMAKGVGTVKYASSFVSSKANHLLVRLRGENKVSSKTEADDSKMYQYYAVRLKDYKGKKLNETPQGLLRFCYVIDKNWSFVNKVYKTWGNLKDRVMSWGDIK